MPPTIGSEAKETLVKKVVAIGGIAALAGALMFNGGCEWSGGGGADSFNTSQGAGINVNFSGVYHGHYPGGKAVENSSGAAITRLTLTQSGDSIQVLDNNGNQYSGHVGSPGAVFTPTEANPVIPAGAQLMQAQVNFSGTDGSSGREINFVGIVHVVSVTDIKSTTQTSGSGSTNASSTSSSQPITTTQTHNDGTNTTVTTTIVTPVSTIVTVETHNNQTGQTISKTTTETANKGQSQTQGTSQTQTYTITEANSQYRLEGQWVEKGGNSSGVDALSSGASGVVSQTIN